MSETLYDKKGIPLEDWDLFRIDHFTARRKRKVFMYKVARNIDGRWYGYELHGLLLKGEATAHRYLMDECDSFEILDGMLDSHDLQMFWERKRKRVPSAADPA